MPSFTFLPYSRIVQNTLEALKTMSPQWFFCLIPLLLRFPQRVHGFGMHLMEISETDRSQIVCTLALLQKYFQYGEPLSGSVISMSLTTASLHIQQDLLNALHTQVAIPWTVVVRNPRQATTNVRSSMILHEKPQCYFIVIENLEDGDLEDVFEDWKTNINWNPLAQFVVYLAPVEETDDEMTELMIEILLSFMNKKIYNVNVIGRNEENSFYYGKTVFPYHPDNNCGNRVIATETLDMCYYQDEDKPKYDYNFDEEDGDEEFDYDGGDDDVGQRDDDGNNDGKAEENEKRDNYGERNDYENRDEDEGDGEEGKSGQDRDGRENDYENTDKNVDRSQETYREEDKFGNGNNDEEMSENTDQAADGFKTDEDNDEESDVAYDEIKSMEEENQNEQRKEIDAERDRQDKTIGNFVEGKYKCDVIKNSGKIEESVTVNESADYENIDKQLEKDFNISDYEIRFNNEVVLNKYKIGNGGFLDANRKTKNNGEAEQTMKANGKESGMGWGYNDFEKRSQPNLKTETRLRTTSDDKKKSEEKRNSKVLQNRRNLRKKRQLLKHQKLIDYNQDDANDMQTQNIYIQELYRASFFEKIPKDLSGCPVVAAFRPWEPYIFKEANVYESKTNDKHRTDDSNEYLANEATAYDTENGEESNNYTYDETDDDTEADNSYNDVDTADLSDEPEMKLNGIEYQLVQTIGERLHITIDLQLENSNLYHLFQQLIDGDIEMILGGIDEDPSISQFVSSSIAYHQDDLTWCVARAKRKYGLFNFLQSFHISTWLCTVAFILITSLNIYLAQKLLNIQLSYFGGFFATFVRILGIILSQSTQLTSLPTSLRITFGSTFFLAIMFVNFYQSFLVSTLTTPRSSSQISHLEEIYRNRMTVTGSVENVRHLNKDGEIFKYIREKFEMCYNIEECLNRAATDESLAVAVSRQHSFYNPHIKRDQLYCFDRNENLYVYLVTMLLPKKFHLLHKINPVIQHIIESGHMYKWARELDLIRRIREEIQRAQKVLVKSLTIKQVGGSFALHGMLSMLATVIFLLECWTHWMVVKRRTRLRLVKWLHRKFSSK